MAEYAPEAIRQLFNQVKVYIAEAVLSGILGDRAHTYGYHRCRDVLAADDYSRQYAEDQAGDGQAASALDISLPPNLMKVVAQRLMTAMRNGDPRTKALREFFGTIDGVTVTGWDRHNPNLGGDDSFTSSDDSHLWHIHLSFYRKYANDLAALLPIADVIGGITHPYAPSSGTATEIGADSLSAAEVADLKKYIDAAVIKVTKYVDDTALALAGQKPKLPSGHEVTSNAAVHASIRRKVDLMDVEIEAKLDGLAKAPVTTTVTNAGIDKAAMQTLIDAAFATHLKSLTGTITLGGK